MRNFVQAIRNGRHARERQMTGSKRATERTPVGAAGVQPVATESTTLPGSTLLAPGLARLKIKLLPHDGHASPARNILRLPPLPVARSGVTVPEVRDLSLVQPAAAESTTLPGSTPPTAVRLAPEPTATPPTRTAAPWTTPAMRDFSHLTYVFVRRGMYNHIGSARPPRNGYPGIQRIRATRVLAAHSGTRILRSREIRLYPQCPAVGKGE